MRKKVFLLTLWIMLFGVGQPFQVQAVFAYTMEDLLKLTRQIQNENPGIDFKIRTDKEGYKLGEDVAIEFMSDKDCYLALIDVGTSGKTLVLFPNKWHPDNKIEKGKIYKIPPPGSNFSFKVMGPAGEEHIKAIASLDQVLSKIDSLQAELKQPVQTQPEKGVTSPGEVFLSMKDPGVVLKDIGVVFKQLDPSKWATAELSFKIDDSGQSPPAATPPLQPPTTKPAGEAGVVKSKKASFEISYDPKKWALQNSVEAPIEFSFQHSDKEAFINIISERTEIPTETLKKAFMKNLEGKATDVKIVEEKEIKIGETPVVSLTLDLKADGIPLTFYNYLWSGNSGTAQVMCFCGQTIFNDHKDDFQKFMNGITITKKQ
jgi:Domain of unknown function (DUF4384)